MALSKSIKRSPVWRVTVDEALDESLKRLLIAPLAKGVRNAPLDDIGSWLDEKEVIVTMEDCLNYLGLRGDKLVSAAQQIEGAKKKGIAAKHAHNHSELFYGQANLAN